jgi:pyruvate/2-oxoglutarate dehydrogenase complex dihydrolipoamide dehydrogenase (E3) component
VVILATGSNPILPQISGIDKPHVFSSIDVLNGKQIPGKSVVVVGGGLVGVELAEILLKQGKKIILVEMLSKIAGDLGKTRRGFSLNSLKSNEVRVITGAKCTDILEKGVVIEHASGREMVSDIDAIVISVGFRPENSLVEYLETTGREYYVIGDAHHPGKALDAIWEAAELARKI